jgi:Domain of Unknown Function with PDB structure (DUF3857)
MRRLTAFSLLLFAACAPRFNWPEFRMAQHFRGEALPGVNAIVQDASDTLTYSVDGMGVRATLVRYRRIKVLTQEGVRASEVHLPFSARMRLESFDGRVFNSTGNDTRMTKANLGDVIVKRPLAEKGIREVGEAVMPIPNVMPGSVFDYFATYEIPDALLLEPIVMRDRLPIERAELLIIAPTDVDLDLRFLELGRSVTTAPVPAEAPSSSQVAHRFVLRDLPALIREEQMPSPARIGPAIWPVFRGMRAGKKGPSMQRWEEVLTWLETKTHVGSGGDGTQNDAEKLHQIFQTEAFGMNVDDTYLRLGERKIGTGDDRISAGLKLYDALSKHNFKVGLGLVSRESAGIVLPEVPSPAPFDAVVPAVSISGKTIYLDPACPSCPLDQVSQELEGATVVAIFNDGAHLETLPMRDPKSNAYSVTVSLKVGVNGDASGSAQAVTQGAPATRVRAAYTKKDTVDYVSALGLKDDLKATNLHSPDSNAASMTFESSFDLVSPCKEESQARLRCGLELFMKPIMPELWRESRTQDLLLPNVFQHTLVVIYQLPAKARVELPPPMTASSKFGEYSMSYQQEPGQLALTRRFVISQRRVAADDYEDFHAFVSKARKLDEVAPTIELFAEDRDKPAAEDSQPKTKGKKSRK